MRISTLAQKPRSGANLYPGGTPAGEPKLAPSPVPTLKPVLVDLSVAKAILGLDSDGVSARIDSGRIRWAFDVSPGNCVIRAIRIWSVCLTDPQRAADASLEDILALAVGGALSGSETPAVLVEARWMITSQTVRRLRLKKLIKARLRGKRKLMIDRASLRTFLAERLIQ